MLYRVAGLVFALGLLGCGSDARSIECEGLPLEACLPVDGGLSDGTVPDGGASLGDSVVVSVAWLQDHSNDPELQLIDTRRSGYEAGRIPGAVHLTPGELVTTVGGVAGQAMAPTEAQPVLRAAGVRDDATLVIYGTGPEYDPARVVWLLRYYGHDDARYLDGGYAAWVDSGGAVDSDPPMIEASDYTILTVNDSLRVTGDWVLSELGDAPYDMAAIQLVDARSASEYSMGRIPTARNVDWNLNHENGFMRPRSEVEALYEGLDPAETTVTYCVTGLRGSFAWLSLTWLGYDDVRLYDGSWSEWGVGSFPVEGGQ